MKRLLAAALLLASAAAAPAAAAGSATAGSAAAGSAQEIAAALQESMGGSAFAAARVLRFTWAFERDGERAAAYEHSWDRWTGDYRLEGTDRESGEPWLALFNVESRQGRAWLGGEELAGDALAERLEMAYGRFINDTYWLLMPWKWLDPGVHLAYAGTAEVDGETCDVVELTFGEAVGLTPNDRYRGYVSRTSGLMVRWSYILQNEDLTSGEGEPTVWRWTEWQATPQGVWLSARRERLGDGPPVAIVFPALELVDEPSAAQLEAWFARPE
ncbi:MAG: hypothetical protein OES32_02135 [Acidobacteriota bacterium]|nr:hypothetical protein [Acidobacteriota bacterium]